MAAPNRFRRDGDYLLCSGCGGGKFRYKVDAADWGEFRLKLRTSDGPITVDAGDTRFPNLTAEIKCAGCGIEYTPLSRWDPA